MKYIFLILAQIICLQNLCGTNPCLGLGDILKDYLVKNSVISCVPFDGGRSYDKTYKINFSDGSIVAFKHLNSVRPLLNRQSIIAATHFIGLMNWGPQIVWHSGDYKEFLMEFIEGDPLKEINGYEEEMGLLLSEMHAQLKNQSFLDLVQHYSLFERTVKRLSELKELNLIDPFDQRHLEQLLLSIEVQLNQDRSFLLHNDLKPTNILVSKKNWKFLDWGEISVSSFYDELGALSFYFNLSESQNLLLLKGYFGRLPTVHEQAFLKAHRKIACLHFLFWSLRYRKTNKILKKEGAHLKNESHLIQSIKEKIIYHGPQSVASGDLAKMAYFYLSSLNAL